MSNSLPSDSRVVFPGEVLPGAAYRLDEFLRRVNWGRAALRRARRQGLRVVRDGRSVFVLGDEFIRYLSAAMDQGGPARD